MSAARNVGRKGCDALIIRLNSFGLSLRSIGREAGIHQSTVAERLDLLGVPRADTRRSFAEDLYNSMPEGQRAWLAEKLGPQFTMKDFIQNTLSEMYIASKTQTQKADNDHE